jgi:hypothetical protein
VTTYAGPASAIDAGGDDLCILLTSGDAECHGTDTDGELAAYAGGDAEAVATSGTHTCVLTAAGDVDCWGRDSHGQAADRSGGDAVALSVGPLQTCVLTAGGDVDCWGRGPVDYDGGDATAVSAERDICVFHPIQGTSRSGFDCRSGTDYPVALDPAQETDFWVGWALSVVDAAPGLIDSVPGIVEAAPGFAQDQVDVVLVVADNVLDALPT